MADRRRFLKTAALGVTAAALSSRIAPALADGKAAGMSGGRKPRVISTWDFGVPANLAAWAVLAKGGRALDAVEAGVMIPEADLKNHSVGRAGYPDRDGHVSLDASIMDGDGSCGAVAALEASPIRSRSRAA